MKDWIDRAAPTRSGEELDLEALEAYLLEHLQEAEGETEGPLSVDQFPSGYSNLTYLLRLGDRELVLRRPPFGNRVATAHDMEREHRVLSGLTRVYPPAPEPYLYCADESVIGAPFYVMERRRGIVLRRELPPGLELDPPTARSLSESLIDGLAQLHLLDPEDAGLGDMGKPEGYVERQVRGWAKRYERARTDDWPAFEAAGEWLLETMSDHVSDPADAAVIHNDYKYDNVLLDPDDLTRIVAVLDWEMCTVGDPLMDLGTSLAYWVQADDPEPFRRAAFGPTWVPGSLTRAELATRYAEATGREPGDLTFYVVYGLFKLGGIVQQIYYRYDRGHTKDPRFAELNQLVGLLGEVALGMVRSGRI